MRLSLGAIAFVAVLAAAAAADNVAADKKSKSKSEKEVSMKEGAGEGAQTQNRMEPKDEQSYPRNDFVDHHAKQKKAAGGYSLFQGDMLVTYDKMVELHGEEFASNLKESGFVFPPSFSPEAVEVDDNRAVVTQTIWPQTNRLSDDKFYIPYEVDRNSYSGWTTAVTTIVSEITSAMNAFADDTQMFEFIDYSQWQALNAVGANIPDHFIRFESRSGEGCWSWLGKTTTTQCTCTQCTGTCQTIGLEYNETSGVDYCIYEGTVVHEIMHAIGFEHEHSRNDRDNYVMINFQNIPNEDRSNYEISTASTSLDTTYDFYGVMHYQFGQAITPIVALPEPFNTYNWLVGVCDGASNTDLDQIRLLYQCDSGPRNLTDAQADGWCTPDCPCWEDAPYECESNSECQGGLTCADRVEVLVARQEPCCDTLVDLNWQVPSGSCVPPALPQPTKICQQPVATNAPSDRPSTFPSTSPSSLPSSHPSSRPSLLSEKPSATPSAIPSTSPSSSPSSLPSSSPSSPPTSENEKPSGSPSSSPAPSASPSVTASANPTTSMAPSDSPSNVPSHAPSASPSDAPSNHPSSSPTNTPSASPSSAPSAAPTISQAPTSSPSASPSGDSDEPSSQPSAAPTSCPTGQVFIPTNYWVPPLDKPGMTCQHVRIKIPDHGEFACLPIGSGICRDNGGSMSKWRFGVEEVETPPCQLSGKCPVSAEPTDTFPVLIDPALTRYPITGTTFTDSNTGEICRNGYNEAIRGCNYAGTTHVCIGEDIEANANRYSNERPYMFFYNEKTHQFLYQLVCDGIGEEGKLPQLKMVNHEALADATTVDYPIDMVKFKKGATPYTDDSNELWKMYVDWNGFEDPATRRRGKLASFIGVAHTKFCTEYVSATERACWKEDCSMVDTPAAYERPDCIV